jgi:hypothetical protein
LEDCAGHHFFETFGPFEIEKTADNICRPKSTWWDEIDKQVGCEVSRAIGCYMFVMGNSNIKPWYVGKTVNQRGFREEVFTGHKLGHYNWVIDEGYRGPPQIYLFPMITRPFDQDWKFCSGSSHSAAIEWLERTMIGMAYSQNRELANLRDTTFLRTVHVRGVIGSAAKGRRTGHIGKARQALLGDKQD